MTPDERQLITGLFDRMKPIAGQQRDRDAEMLIGDQVRAQPYAPYLMAQTVIVQDQALRAANDKIQQLEDDVRKAQSGSPQAQGDTSFLGGLGRSIFGGAAGSVPITGGHAPVPAPQGYAQQPGYGQQAGYAQQQGYAQQPGGPWGQQSAPAGGGGLFGGGGGGFMKGALGAAAGVAGGVLMADGIRNLFSGGNNPYGIASGFGGGEGMGGGFGNPGGETIINNNYYDGQQQGDMQDTGGQGGNDPGGYTNDPGSYGGGGGDPGGYGN